MRAACPPEAAGGFQVAQAIWAGHLFASVCPTKGHLLERAFRTERGVPYLMIQQSLVANKLNIS